MGAMRRLVGFGDSLTAGVFIQPEESFLYRLGQRFSLETVNAGVPGNTSTQGLKRMKEDVLDRHPDFCTVVFGMNDHYAIGPNQPNVSVEDFRLNLERIIQALRTIKCVPILCTVHSILEGTDTSYYYGRHPRVWYENPVGAQAWIDRYNEMVREVSLKTDTTLADVAERWRNELLSGVKLGDLLRTMENSGSDDGTHPTALGHAVYADCIGESLSAILNELIK
ncbi:SGNH/GDSL hydrolase family protein [Paenibacillus sp. J2TS4]|uniref:SGNH/GDSL hydrolase family protein n=1 Tax=Paenibacillus sp. J2TS4 TaxID=2807194 RepID=UPI001B2645A1|nr:SGNH/GDSL hydrolase family protein [Paenibacillus sp. J2TS4]GIP31878.1 hypothetical protein J2TS4_10880 [Paenibacillus sp. J2TS4]